jgi:hypothetical protein
VSGDGTVRLRYTGTHPQAFTGAGRHLEPGDEFEVPAAEAERYLRRPDIEEAEAPRRKRPPPGQGGNGEPAA